MNRLVTYISSSIAVALFAITQVIAQPSFVERQRSYSRADAVFSRVEDSLKKQFERKNLVWPPETVYIRSFKIDRKLEVWVKNRTEDQFKLFKEYKVCMQSGKTGPKRAEGDLQVPEGFYYINEFNPNSNYHLALGLNYPNASDRILSDSIRPGGEIYIHGNCVSTGCIAIADQPIEELYIITSNARANGQDFIPVHVFPVKYNDGKSMDKMIENFKSSPAMNIFILNLRKAYDYFEKNKQLPLIMINAKGEYIIN